MISDHKEARSTLGSLARTIDHLDRHNIVEIVGRSRVDSKRHSTVQLTQFQSKPRKQVEMVELVFQQTLSQFDPWRSILPWILLLH